MPSVSRHRRVRVELTATDRSSSVKSYANVVLSSSVNSGKTFNSISKMPTTWKYSYTGSSIVADVAYDLFSSSSSSGSSEYEVMIWLAALGGAGPISSTGSTIATPTIDGVSWKLYDGYNGAMHVYSFVASSQVTSFSGDIMDFINWLSTNEGYPKSQYLTSIGAGTEPFTGSGAKLTTTAYSLTLS
jgi:xyloglucan-specific endo-beta-1,4-glucanase